MTSTRDCRWLKDTEQRQERGPEPGKSQHRLEETLFAGSPQTTRTSRVFSGHTYGHLPRGSIWWERSGLKASQDLGVHTSPKEHPTPGL